jgi:hypothetical protein
MLYDDFFKRGKKSLLGGGNLYGVLPYEGRYDASNLWMLQLKNNNWHTVIPGTSGFYLPGEVRDIKTMRSINGSKYFYSGPEQRLFEAVSIMKGL